MKRFDLALWLTSALLVFCMSLGAVLCPVTSFDIPVSLQPLILGCGGFAVLFTLIFSFRRAWIGLLPVTAAGGYAIWYWFDQLAAALSLAANTVAPHYVAAFRLGKDYVVFPGLTPSADALAFCLLAAALLSLLLAWAVVRLQSPQVCLLAVLPLLALCLIILETVPSAAAVLLVMGPLLLLALTRQTAVHSPRQAAKLRLWMLAPLAALLALLVFLSPPKSYQRAQWPDKLRYAITDLADQVTFLQQNEQTGQLEFVSPLVPSTLGAMSWDSDLEESDLSQVGPMRRSPQRVMRVLAERGGAVYLRGSSMERYENSRWTATPQEDLDAFSYGTGYLPLNQKDPKTTVEVDTVSQAKICYMPYHTAFLPQGMALMGDAWVENTDRLTEYTFTAADPASCEYGYGADADYGAYVKQRYLQLPGNVRAAFADYAAETSLPSTAAESLTIMTWAELVPQLNPEFFDEDDYHMLAQEVARTIRQGKTYSLNTPQVPAGEDFVTWFLNDSDTGYCVHFATAATLFLRYIGIPARYVTGYVVNAQEGVWTAVQQGNAHAWVEYYVEGVGWCILEATPADVGANTEVIPNENQEITEEKEEIPDVEEENEPVRPQPPQSETEPETTENDTQGSVATNDAKKLPSWLWAVIGSALGLCALAFGYRSFVLHTRKRQFATGSTNKRAVMLYRHGRKLSKLAGKEMPKEWTDQAERAKFSHHKLTEEEVALFQSRCDELTEELMQTGQPAKKFLYRMIYVIR